MKKLLFILLICAPYFMLAQTSQNSTELKGDYLGQTLPGDIPMVFAPGIVSIDTTIEHGTPTFSPDGNEVFWQVNSRDHTVINCMTIKRINNVWTTKKITPYGSGPVFSPDGKRLYFNSKKDEGYICFIEKQGKNWSKPKTLGLIARFPELKFAYNISFTKSGTLYFLAYAEGYWNNLAIYRSQFVDGNYIQAELLPEGINMPGNIRNWTPFIAPDESYLLFSSNRRSPKTDAGDIYISLHNSDGSWTSPIEIDRKVNSNRQERFPSVSPDGKYLFFTRWVARGNEDVMWVSAEIIKKINKKH